jgi:hypothetical protein
VLASAFTYHRFVKTTPKPRATKKSSGELVGPPPPPPPVFAASVGVARVSKAIVAVVMVRCDNSSVPCVCSAVGEVGCAVMYISRPDAESPWSM